jgi:hypothetical protein
MGDLAQPRLNITRGGAIGAGRAAARLGAGPLKLWEVGRRRRAPGWLPCRVAAPVSGGVSWARALALLGVQHAAWANAPAGGLMPDCWTPCMRPGV